MASKGYLKTLYVSAALIGTSYAASAYDSIAPEPPSAPMPLFSYDDAHAYDDLLPHVAVDKSPYEPSQEQIEHAKDVITQAYADINARMIAHTQRTTEKSLNQEGRIFLTEGNIFSISAQPLEPNIVVVNDILLRNILNRNDVENLWNKLNDGDLTQDEFDRGLTNHINDRSPRKSYDLEISTTYDPANGRICIIHDDKYKDCFSVEEVSLNTQLANDIRDIKLGL